MNSEAVSLARRLTDVEEGVEHELEAALLPGFLVDGLPLLVAHGQGGPLAEGVRHAARDQRALLVDLVVVLLDVVEEGLVDRAVAGGMVYCGVRWKT